MFSEITILAPGLLGASLAQAIRARGLAEKTRIWSRRPESRLKASKQPWCDQVFDSPEAASEGSDLVIICAPVDRIAPLAQSIAGHLKPGCLVTDVGSVKGEICRFATAAMAGRGRFVGSHPMAGSEKSGMDHANPELFAGRPCFVTPLPESDTEAVDKLTAFWDALGCKVTTVPPDAHDEIVAHISHLPHFLASTLCAYLATRDGSWHLFSGPGLSDSTRIAAGDPGLWREILFQNREEVLRAVRNFQHELESFQAALANRDQLAVESVLSRGKQYRDQLRSRPS